GLDVLVLEVRKRQEADALRVVGLRDVVDVESLPRRRVHVVPVRAEPRRGGADGLGQRGDERDVVGVRGGGGRGGGEGQRGGHAEQQSGDPHEDWNAR